MAELFNNKYRIPSARLQSWDYGSPGMYFVTICTKNRAHYFGDIVAPWWGVETRCIASLRPTEIGQIAHDEWFKTPELRPDMNLQLGEFVVMPNHIHGIIIIGADTVGGGTERRGVMHRASTFGPQSKNLASILRGYKSAVTTYARKNNIEFDWQPRFHDHIIRNQGEFERISNYIRNNPEKWAEDRFYR